MTNLTSIKCPFCDNEANIMDSSSDNDFDRFNCSKLCGQFKLESFFTNKIRLNDIDKIKLRYRFKILPKGFDERLKTLSTSNIQEILDSISYPSSLLDKIQLVLEYIYKKTDSLFQHISLDTETEYPLFYCNRTEELTDILKYLKDQKYIDFCYNSESFYGKDPDNPVPNFADSNWVCAITPEGIKHIEASGKNPKSNQCFVAMWFSDETNKAWKESISTAIEESGYEPVRIDEVQHSDDINDRIISEIRRSKFMIVDLTGNKGGVYFEVGFGFGLGLPVIYTCKKENLNEVHFDLNHRNMILWEEGKHKEFKQAIIDRIGAIVGLNNVS